MSDNPMQLLNAPAAGDDERLATLHAALVERASTESAVDATYRVVDSPVGSLLLAATENGVLRVAFEIEDHDRVLESPVASGSPKAVRAVGSACATNPLPIVVPCHRVVRSDGSLGGYLGGLPTKQRLLALEQAA